MEKRKRRTEGFAFYDHRGICNHLERMAEKGWMIRKIGVFWEYEAIEPRKMHFAVSCCAGEDGYFKGDKEEILHLEKWRLACRSEEMAIFCCEEEEVPPFCSTAKEELEAVHTIMKKRKLPSWLLLSAVLLLQEWSFFSALRRDLVGQLADMGAILGAVCFFIMLLIFLGEMIRYFKWYFPAKKEVLNGVFPAVKGSGRIGKAMFGVLAAVLVCWLLELVLKGGSMAHFLAALMFIWGVLVFVMVYKWQEWMEKRKIPSRTGRTIGAVGGFVLSVLMLGLITAGILKASEKGVFISEKEETYEYGGRVWAVFEDELPLSLEDLTGEEYESYTRENKKEESPFIRQEIISQRPRLDAENFRELPELDYTLVTVKMSGLYDQCRQFMIQDGERHDPEGERVYQAEDPALWGAKEAYRIHDSRYGFRNQYLVCWENILLEIHFPWEPDEGQKEIVRKNLNRSALGH